VEEKKEKARKMAGKAGKKSQGDAVIIACFPSPRAVFLLTRALRTGRVIRAAALSQ
jgi:hypothetical protein